MLMWNDGWGHMGDWSWGWGIFGMSMMVLFWGAIILLVFYAVRSTMSQSQGSSTNATPETDRALAILQERYARGEIDREEYETRRRVLEEPLSTN